MVISGELIIVVATHDELRVVDQVHAEDSDADVRIYHFIGSAVEQEHERDRHDNHEEVNDENLHAAVGWSEVCLGRHGVKSQSEHNSDGHGSSQDDDLGVCHDTRDSDDPRYAEGEHGEQHVIDWESFVGTAANKSANARDVGRDNNAPAKRARQKLSESILRDEHRDMVAAGALLLVEFSKGHAEAAEGGSEAKLQRKDTVDLSDEAEAEFGVFKPLVEVLFILLVSLIGVASLHF